MPRVLALLALVILAPRALAQDTEDSDTDTAWLDGAVGASGEAGGGPACGCAPGIAGPSVAPILAALALLARRR